MTKKNRKPRHIAIFLNIHNFSNYLNNFLLYRRLLNILMISRYLRRACCGEKKPYLAGPSNTQDTCHMNLASDGFAQHWVWLGGRASERPIQSSEIPFFTGTQNHSWYNTRDMTIKHLSATLLRPSRSISFWRKNINFLICLQTSILFSETPRTIFTETIKIMSFVHTCTPQRERREQWYKIACHLLGTSSSQNTAKNRKINR